MKCTFEGSRHGLERLSRAEQLGSASRRHKWIRASRRPADSVVPFFFCRMRVKRWRGSEIETQNWLGYRSSEGPDLSQRFPQRCPPKPPLRVPSPPQQTHCLPTVLLRRFNFMVTRATSCLGEWAERPPGHSTPSGSTSALAIHWLVTIALCLLPTPFAPSSMGIWMTN